MGAKHRISITTRITLFTGAVAALLCALLATALMIAINRYVTGSLIGEITAAGGRVAIQMERGQLDYPLVQHRSRNLQVVDPQGRVVASTPQLRGKPVMATFTPDGTNITTSVVCGGVFPSDECEIVVAQWVHRAGQKWIVYSASPAVAPWVDPRLAAAVGGGAVMLAAAITYLGRRVVIASLRPVTAIRGELDEINATCLDRRVPVPSSDDEIYRLADSVNHTLTRLQAAMEQQRQFTADSSHELRTPVAGLRAQLEEAQLHPGETDLNDLLAHSLSDVDRIQQIITDLLLLAQLGYSAPELRERIDLATVVRTEVSRRADPHKVRLIPAPEVPVDAIHSQIGRVISNLLDNAERHARQAVVVEVRRTGDSAELVVDDDGQGIAEADRERIFERFTRLDTARSRDRGGTGLGLAIARSIAQAHDGRIEVGNSAAGGARFVLRLPLAKSRNNGPETRSAQKP
jgi:signal transduction histidine kinase